MARNKAARVAEEERRINTKLEINKEDSQQTSSSSTIEGAQVSSSTPQDNAEVVLPSARKLGTSSYKRGAPSSKDAKAMLRKCYIGVLATRSPIATNDDNTPSKEED